MKKLFFILPFLLRGLLSLTFPGRVQAALLSVKLPYGQGQSFVVTQGFHTPPTHIKKDDFAIDFTQNGCDAYGKFAVAAIAGKVLLVQQSGYDGGYGTQILLLSSGNIVTRYAHLIVDSVGVAVGDAIAQGSPLGLIGNTGLVAGTACGIHPGTHLHFAMDRENADGSFTAQDPEPISGYSNITQGHWYLSDNGLPANLSQSNGTAAIAFQMARGDTRDVSGANSSSIVAPSLNGINSGTFPSSSSFAENISSDSLAQVSASDNFFNTTTALPAIPALLDPSSSLSLSSGNFSASQTPILLPTGGVIAMPSSPTGNMIGGFSADPALNNISYASGTASSSVLLTANSSTLAENNNSSSFTQDVLMPEYGANSLAIFNTSTLAVDLAWQVPANASGPGSLIYDISLTKSESSSSLLIMSTTSTSFSYAIPDADFGGNDTFAIQAIDGAGEKSVVTTTTVALPNWLSNIQAYDGADSQPSWYSDNWYDLGTGFMGTMRSLTLEGYINSDLFGGSTLSIQEFPDATYTTPDHTFPLPNMPFIQTVAKLTAPGLKIPLSPTKYYRLTTVQSYQNRSVILKGTNATGTAMWDNYVYGVGGIEYPYSFYPYMTGIIDPQELAIAPPSLLGNIIIIFDPAQSTINVAWPAATDADEPLVPPTYQINISTSTTLDPAQWQSEGTKLTDIFPVTLPHTYTIGVRALDDFNHPSLPLTVPWSFPPNYAPLAQFDHSAGLTSDDGAQKITFIATTTASAINFWTAYAHGGATHSTAENQLFIYKDIGSTYSAMDPTSVGVEIPSGNPVVTLNGFGDGLRTYSFAAPITFSPGSYWFALVQGPSRFIDETVIYGSSDDVYSGGSWSTLPNQDAYFQIVQ